MMFHNLAYDHFLDPKFSVVCFKSRLSISSYGHALYNHTEIYFILNRIMVDLPSMENREMILRTLLSKEKVEDLDFKELAAMTEGYTGSDLKV